MKRRDRYRYLAIYGAYIRKEIECIIVISKLRSTSPDLLYNYKGLGSSKIQCEQSKPKIASSTSITEIHKTNVKNVTEEKIA